jgi:hypothetical protein
MLCTSTRLLPYFEGSAVSTRRRLASLEAESASSPRDLTPPGLGRPSNVVQKTYPFVTRKARAAIAVLKLDGPGRQRSTCRAPTLARSLL